MCHTADYLFGDADLDARRFSWPDSKSLRTEGFSESELLAVDLVDDDLSEPDLSMAQSAFIEPDPNHLEPDVSMPIKAAMVTMPSGSDERIASVDATRSRSDVMTRVLQQSRGQ